MTREMACQSAQLLQLKNRMKIKMKKTGMRVRIVNETNELSPQCQSHPARCLLHSDAVSTMKALRILQARSSVWLERFLDTEEVDGSSPFGPTIFQSRQIFYL